MERYIEILLVAMCLNVFSLQAQTPLQKKLMQNCKSELEDICKKNVKINDVAFNSDGHWLILFGETGYSFSYVPSPLEQQLVKLNSEGKTLTSSCLLNDTSWILFYDQGNYISEGLPQNIQSRITTAKKKSKVKRLSNQNNSFTILYGNNGFMAQGIPQPMLKKMASLNSSHATIRDARTFDNGGWIILYGQKGIAFQGLNENLSLRLQKLAKQGTQIDIVRCVGKEWLLVYGNKVESSFANN